MTNAKPGLPFDQLGALSPQIIASAPPTPAPESLLWNDNGFLALLLGENYPSSPDGLAPGDLWDNGISIGIAPGATPDPAAPLVFFGEVTAAQLLALGGGNLPLTAGPAGSGQLWNNENTVCSS